MPTLSIIIPVYNSEKYLKQCLDSILAQASDDFEILLIDDGSTDFSGKLCDEYASRYNNIYVFHEKNRGVSAARNKGIERAQGEYVIFVDSDDWLEKNALSFLMAQESDVDLIFYGSSFHSVNGNVTLYSPNLCICHGFSEVQEGMIDLITNPKYYDYLGFTWNKVFRSNILKEYNIRFIENLSYREDEVFTLHYAHYCKKLMILPNIENFIGCDSSFEEAGIVLYGAPFDSTTSFRPGARFGPSAIRHESFGLETYSPYQDSDLTDIQVFDSGDLELCFGSSEMALADIQNRAWEILEAGKIPLLLGGEHLVTLAAVRATARKYPGLHIIHFDAHADLRDDYLGARLSHACVIRRCHDILGDGRIHQFCIRSGEREEFRFAKEHTDLHPFTFEGLEETIQELDREQVPVYFTIDLDCLDPSVFPGTGTPEAGGVSFLELLAAIRKVSELNIVGADVNELAPMLDPSGVSTATACKVVRELLLAVAK